jgi:hypothetical protein
MTVERGTFGRGGAFRRWVIASTALALGGCSFASDALFPSFSGEPAPTAPVAAAPAPAVAPEESRGFFSSLFGSDEQGTAPAPSLIPAPTMATPAAYSGTTAVGQRVTQFRGEYEALKSSASNHGQQFNGMRSQTIGNANAYNAAVGAIRSRLQIGTTPGNPELLAQWQEAQSRLTASDGDLSSMNQLSALVAADAGAVGYLLDNVRSAFTLSGAVDEDHRQLRMLEDELAQTNITIDRLLQSLTADIARQQQFITAERNGLVDLAAGINVGGLYTMANRNAAAQPARTMPTNTPATFSDRRPLVVIRFDKPDVAYEPALYQALSRALERRPDAVFDLVAVTPPNGNSNAARRNADNVMRSMTGMGLPNDRVIMASMSNPTAATPEVHVYVR